MFKCVYILEGFESKPELKLELDVKFLKLALLLVHASFACACAYWYKN